MSPVNPAIGTPPLALNQPLLGVDAHFHVFEAACAQPGARYVPAYPAPLAAWQDLARPWGVSHGVVVQTSFMGTDNRLLLAQLDANPQTLRGVAVIASDAPARELADMHARGVRGIRINLAGQSHDMHAWASARPMWDHLLQQGWHVEVHTDNGQLPGVLNALPVEIPVVLDHFARPATASAQDETVQALRQRQRQGGVAHFKLSAPYRLAAGLNPVDLCQVWLAEWGPEALVWGSDWPFTNHEAAQTYGQQYAALATWLGHDSEALQRVRWTNPARLYGFGPG